MGGTAVVRDTLLSLGSPLGGRKGFYDVLVPGVAIHQTESSRSIFIALEKLCTMSLLRCSRPLPLNIPAASRIPSAIRRRCLSPISLNIRSISPFYCTVEYAYDKYTHRIVAPISKIPTSTTTPHSRWYLKYSLPFHHPLAYTDSPNGIRSMPLQPIYLKAIKIRSSTHRCTRRREKSFHHQCNTRYQSNSLSPPLSFRFSFAYIFRGGSRS